MGTRQGGKQAAKHNGQLRPSRDRPPDLPLALTDHHWQLIQAALRLSPQQARIVRLMQEEDLGTDAIVVRLGNDGTTTRRSVEKQIERVKAKLSDGLAEERKIRSRAAIVNRVWVEFWRLREHQP